jgi:hypothetical protein
MSTDQTYVAGALMPLLDQKSTQLPIDFCSYLEKASCCQKTPAGISESSTRHELRDKICAIHSQPGPEKANNDPSAPQTPQQHLRLQFYNPNSFREVDTDRLCI